MKRLIVATVALAAMTASSFAADIRPSRMEMAPVRGPAILPFNWGGWYAGVNLGGGWANDSVDGIVGGAQIGFNWQMNQIVFGVEADIQGTSMSGSRVVVGGGITASETQNLDWFGTFRGRIGYAVMDRWLPYFTIGMAYGGRSVSGTATGAVTGAYSASWTDVGLAIGVGVDYAINPAWTARLEYLYVNIPGRTITYVPGVTVAYGDLDASIFRGALNYRFTLF
jgi:outer membrane immunogenic protein